MPRTLARSALLALVGLTVLAGCGTSGGADAAETTSTTEAPATTEVDDTEASDPEPTDTTEAPETTTTAPDDDGAGDICEPLQVLSQYDQDAAALIAAGDWAETQAFFVEQTDDVLVAYDDAIALDTELTADLEELRAITDGTAELAAAASSIEDLSTELLALPGLLEAGEAGLRLNTFAEETCGFSTGGAGG